jgi:hypothetical protein
MLTRKFSAMIFDAFSRSTRFLRRSGACPGSTPGHAFAGKRSARVCGGATLALLAATATFEPAQAGGIETTNCVGWFGSFSCVSRWGPAGDPHVRQVPAPYDARDAAEFAERERRWVARCRPIVRQDQYGVSRYLYAAPGCEFGSLHD